MATIYERASEDVAELAAPLIKKYHPDIVKSDLHIDWVFARAEPDENGEPTGKPALKLHGYSCLGICKVVPAKERALGRGDVEICLDKDEWDKLPEDRRAALLDHELYHIVIQRSGDGDIVTDPYGRPKVKMKLHDRQYGWFDAIAARHAEASEEVRQARNFYDEAASIYFQPDLFPDLHRDVAGVGA